MIADAQPENESTSHGRETFDADQCSLRSGNYLSNDFTTAAVVGRILPYLQPSRGGMKQRQYRIVGVFDGTVVVLVTAEGQATRESRPLVSVEAAHRWIERDKARIDACRADGACSCTPPPST